MAGIDGPDWRELELERSGSVWEMQHEAYPPLGELQRELKQMRAEMRAAEGEEEARAVEWYTWQKLRMEGKLEFLVDAGPIQRVSDVSARAAAQLSLLDLGDRAQFPVDVYSADGNKTTFILATPPKKPVRSERHVKRERRTRA
jgi:hypothetical protein